MRNSGTPQKLAALLMILSLSACTKATLLGNKGVSAIGLQTLVPDFLKTQIINNGPGVADGVTALTVGVQLKNSDNTVVVGYQPTYQVTQGLGVQSTACTASLNNGLSYCLMKATVPGVKTLKLTNALVGLSASVEFSTAPPNGSLIVPTAGSAIDQVTGPSGYKVSTTIGGMVNHLNSFVTPQGYTVYPGARSAFATGYAGGTGPQ